MTEPTSLVTNDKLSEMIEASDRLTESNDRLALAMVEYQERARLAARRFRLTMIVLGVLTLASLGGIWAALLASNASRMQIEDCITPGGKCYQQSQEQTAQVLAHLEEMYVTTAACNSPAVHRLPDYAQRAAEIRRCVKRELGN